MSAPPIFPASSCCILQSSEGQQFAEAVRAMLSPRNALPDWMLTRRDATGASLLHHACRAGRCDVVVLLVRRGLPVDDVTQTGDTPAHLAALHGHSDILRALCDSFEGKQARSQYVNIRNNDGDTVLHSAVRSANEETVRMLVRLGADPGAKNHSGHTPASLARQCGFIFIAEALESMISQPAEPSGGPARLGHEKGEGGESSGNSAPGELAASRLLRQTEGRQWSNRVVLEKLRDYADVCKEDDKKTDISQGQSRKAAAAQQEVVGGNST